MTVAEGVQAPGSPLFRGSVAQKLRIGSGLILFTFALTHFLNHALGVWSIEAMEVAQEWRTAVNRSSIGTAILAGAFLTHVGLNLFKTARRSTWRMPVWEAVQIALGLTILVMLTYHAAYMRSVHEINGLRPEYSEALPGLWSDYALLQTTLLLVVWTHGCIGLHYWLRLARFYRPLAPLLLAAAVLIPALALAGFVVSGRDAAAEAAAEPAPADDGSGGYDDYSYGGGYDSYGGGYDDYGSVSAAPAARALTPDDVRAYGVWIAAALIAAVGGVIAARALLRRRRRRIRISYSAGPSVLAPVGPTLLEISRMSGVPHASVCGGRARCSTCRVSIDDADDRVPPPNAAEGATLARINAADTVRLACQLRPRGDLKVTRLVHPPVGRRRLLPETPEDAGVEQTLAVLFLDIRGFTALSEARLPYDTVFLLNRFFAEVGDAVTSSGGWIDKYLGDGLMALFGINRPTPLACRAALIATMRIDAALEKLNAELGSELPAPLRIGVGLHVGPLVLGRIGHRASASTTVIGPVVNVASRLESLTKERGVQIVASSDVWAGAGLPENSFPEEVVTVRGMTEALGVILISRGRELTPYLQKAEEPRSAA